ncbi:unnamed protein product [Rotaria sp. Silwood1]|nr:unnamed protein product [Rotaria sp. Silwood1]CAF4869612.1 unnamed protein product [Rotaria sp. Silwood1]CAF4894893.1 unnamed protein product [Rotaria sp. Silwood1]CAF4945831.1 unnamed protein product [Rotaria sp. Silwood1]
MSRPRRNIERFSCTTSRFLLPTFRRPCYREIITTNSICDPKQEVFSEWTKEDGEYYNTINTALLNDDYQVLKNNVRFINSLRMAIKNNNENEPVKVYRGLSLDPEHVKHEYKVGLKFLWPTFTCTSRNRDVAHDFGNYIFEINASKNDWTYRSDISKYSIYPEEQEVLFYPYSGYVVKDIIYDAKIIQLKCIDTLKVESRSNRRIPSCVKIFDSSRNMFVYFYKDSSDIHCSSAEKPNEIFLIAQNMNGYWDAPYRYHHRNGYFLDKGNNQWEEYQNNKLYASPSHFSRVTHLSLYFPSNFGNETTRIYYIGLCGEYLGEVQFKVVITTYEATPQLKDHKVDDFQPGTREIQ